MRVLPAVLASLLLVAAVACNPAAATPTPTPPAQPPPTPTGAPDEPASESFFLDVFTPVDESIVDTAEVTVSGRTTADAVVSVNGATVEPEADGSFETTIALEEGPNLIEVIASNFEGHEETAVITLIYIP